MLAGGSCRSPGDWFASFSDMIVACFLFFYEDLVVYSFVSRRFSLLIFEGIVGRREETEVV